MRGISVCGMGFPGDGRNDTSLLTYLICTENDLTCLFHCLSFSLLFSLSLILCILNSFQNLLVPQVITVIMNYH